MPQRHDTAGEIIETTPPVCDGPSGVQFDLQKLGKYIRPKEYRLYKVRKKSAKLRKRYVFIVPNELIFSVCLYICTKDKTRIRNLSPDPLAV